MGEEYWLINSNRSKVKRFHKNKHNKDKFSEYMSIDSGKITGGLWEKPPVINTREKLKIDKAREE